MKRWIDVDPLDWFYRDTLEMTRLKMDDAGKEILQGMTYNVFEKGHERLVKRFITIEGQKEFLVPEYKYYTGNPIFVLVNGIEVIPETIEDGKVTLTNPLSAGLEVVLVAYGKPAVRQVGCVEGPYTGCSNFKHPSAELLHKKSYFYNVSYPPETCTVLGIKLKRLIVNISPGEDPGNKIRDVLDTQRDKFVIHEGVIYLPYQYNRFPAVVGYNATIHGVKKRTVETVIVESSCVKLNDRFFPKVRIKRGEFFGLLYNILSNLHNRYTDHKLTFTSTPLRFIADAEELDRYWYGPHVRTLFDEKYLNGCYVFPLYSDNSFEGNECLTRAEAATYLHRFIEWIVEKYR